MTGAQFVKGSLVAFRGSHSQLTGHRVHAAGRAVVLKSRTTDRGFEEIVIKFKDGRRLVVMPSEIQPVAVADLLPKV